MKIGHFENKLDNFEKNNLENNERNNFDTIEKLSDKDNYFKDKEKNPETDTFYQKEDLDDSENKLEKDIDNYLMDLKEKSEYPETINYDSFDSNDLRRLSPEENISKREEFADKKFFLKNDWEKKHGMEWPKYKEDVFSESGKKIRKAGDDYDAHHIHPLCLGGQNNVDNITPIHASKHYDHKGIHAKESPYNNLLKDSGDFQPEKN